MKAFVILFPATLFFWKAPCIAGGQWIAVVAPGLEEAVKPLAEQRKSEGWEVTVVPAQADPAAALKQIAVLAEKSQPCCVVLAGDFSEKGVPVGKGTKLRMAGQPSDRTWSLGGKVETGRLPARDASGAKGMVQKILEWPRTRRNRSPFPSAALMAGHHAAPESFTKIADNLTNSLALRLISKLPAAWQLEAAVHIDGSPWQVSGPDVSDAALRMRTTGSTLLAYMGHSNASAAVSKNVAMFGGSAWRAMPPDGPRPGLFFTCGCFSCQVDAPEESFGIAAIRAPGGPPAVIGSHGESWSAMGYLAMSGVISSLEKNPVRVGEFWRATLEGLEKAEISAADFAMLDFADGTQGKVPLADQRSEHLEMWMLLGDPAMPLVPQPAPIEVSADLTADTLTVTGTLPKDVAGSAVRITVERHPSAIPKDLPSVPNSGPDRQKVTSERRRLATEVTFATAEVTATGTSFTAILPVPANAPKKPWTVRVLGNGKAQAAGVVVVP